MAGPRTKAAVAAGFGLAALLSSWNPLAAPFGLLVGLGAALLSLRALWRGGARLISSAALVLSLGALAVSGTVLALTAGVGRDPTGDPVVSAPSREVAGRALDEAAERTRAARDRAAAELSGVTDKPASRDPPKEKHGGK
jgi:hypothetical protein